VGGTALTYSANGNMTTDQEGRTLIYDAWNRLISVKNSGGTLLARYGYDGLNRRITEQVATDSILDAATAAIRDLFYSADWQVLEERVRAGGVIPATADTRYVWSPVYVDAMVLRDRNADGNSATGPGGLEERVYVLQDGNWNTTALIAGSGVSGKLAGDVIQRFAYTPYGKIIALTPGWAEQITPADVPWQYLFQGLAFSEATGLTNARNRDYSSLAGRFIILDPAGFSAGDKNLYRFASNNSPNATDPFGLSPFTDCYKDCMLDAHDTAWAIAVKCLEIAGVAAAIGAGGCLIGCIGTGPGYLPCITACFTAVGIVAGAAGGCCGIIYVAYMAESNAACGVFCWWYT